MIRYFLSSLAILACLCCLPGCGSGGGEAEFTPSTGQTPEDVQAADDYMQQMQQQQKEEYGK